MTTIGFNIDNTNLATITDESVLDTFRITIVSNDRITSDIIEDRLRSFIKNLGGCARVTVDIDRTRRTHLDNDLF